jgi:hypothetical protein
MAPDAVVVESSPTQALKDATPAERKTWRATGNLPAKETSKEKPSTEAASSPAAKEVAAPAAEKPAAEVPAKSADAVTEPSGKPKSAAEQRILDLLADNKKLAQERDDLLKKTATAPTKTEKAPVKPSRNDVGENGQPKYATDEEFLDARDKYVAEMASHQTRQDIAKETRDRQIAEQNRITQQRMVNQIKISTERHPDFAEVLKIETKDGKTTFNSDGMKAVKTGGMIDSWCVESEMGMEILYHLATRPGEVERIQSLNSFQAARELTKLEDKLSALEPPAKETPQSSPAPKNVSGAPAPAASVSGKGTAPTDDEEAALKDGDFKRYQRNANENDWRKKKAS